jgi:GntR family transcriptional regulator
MQPVAAGSRGAPAARYGVLPQQHTTVMQMPHWDQQLPIYQQLADMLAARLLDGEPAEGEPMPSVRALAGQYLLNPLTVTRALQALGDEGLVEARRGLGMFVRPGAPSTMSASRSPRAAWSACWATTAPARPR